jgi:hypothetical protein
MSESGGMEFSRRDVLKSAGVAAAGGLVGTEARAENTPEKEKIREEMRELLQQVIGFFRKVSSRIETVDGAKDVTKDSFANVRLNIKGMLDVYISNAESAMQGRDISTNNFSGLADIFGKDKDAWWMRRSALEQTDYLAALMQTLPLAFLTLTLGDEYDMLLHRIKETGASLEKMKL